MATGSPLGAFADAIFRRLKADDALLALATGGIYSSLPRSGTVAYPYLVIGTRDRGGKTYHGGAMQVEGSRVLVSVDCWSNKNDPTEAHAIQSRVVQLLQRAALSVTGYTLLAGSIACEEEKVFAEVDPELPQQRSLFHGVQHWIGWLDDAA